MDMRLHGFMVSYWMQLLINSLNGSFIKLPLRERCVGNTSRFVMCLTHWGPVTHICVVNLTIIGSNNGLSPGRRQAIIWTNAGLLLIRTLGTNFSEIFSEAHTFSFEKMNLKMSFAKWRPFRLGLNVLINHPCHNPDGRKRGPWKPMAPGIGLNEIKSA